MNGSSRDELNEYLLQMIDYDAETGLLTWKESPSQTVQAGVVAGSLNNHGYLAFMAKKKRLLAHRVAWFLYYGTWPENQIDHINGIRADNRIINLRDVSRTINGQNQKKARRDSRSGLLGVSRHQSGWQATITINGKQTYLGKFDTKEKAYEAYLTAKRQFHVGSTL